MTEDQMVEWHHQLNGCESEQTPGDSEREAWRAVVLGFTGNYLGHNLATKQNFQLNKIPL